LTLNSDRIFFRNSGTNWPYSRMFYPNCRTEFTFETAWYGSF